jgi:hypothetical protein
MKAASRRSTGVVDRLRAHFEAGNVGTIRELCSALGLPEGSVHSALRQLRAEGEAEDVGTKVVSCPVGYGSVVEREVIVWGATSEGRAPVPQDLVRLAMSSRFPLELAWAGELRGQHVQ